MACPPSLKKPCRVALHQQWAIQSCVCSQELSLHGHRVIRMSRRLCLVIFLSKLTTKSCSPQRLHRIQDLHIAQCTLNGRMNDMWMGRRRPQDKECCRL